jgi:transposase-like protein
LNAAEKIDLVRLERSEAERSEAERSGGLTKSAGKQVRMSVPDPEVSAANGRRRFSASYKARIVREADSCTESGEVGALLRREGLYSSQLVEWRRSYRKGAEKALADDKRGRKQMKNPLKPEIERLGRELERTQKKLRQAEIIIEFQKNLCEILGISPTSVSTDEEK